MTDDNDITIAHVGPEGIDDSVAGTDWRLSEVRHVRVSALLPAVSPRLAGEDVEHIHLLSQIDQELLPPIVVHQSTNRVIDGMHRLRAARLRGSETIAAQYFDGDDKAAFVIAVKRNIRHGLPLSTSDREAAAVRILDTHSELSDRSIGELAGLSWKTVGAIRRRCVHDVPQPAVRVGRDGRSRPIDGSVGRRLASAIISDHPEASLRQIARSAGISVATARDVRERINRGEDPVPARLRHQGDPAKDSQPIALTGNESIDVSAALHILRRDPSLRMTDSGRALLRWLDRHALSTTEYSEVMAAMPPHVHAVIEAIARRSAQTWTEFANAARTMGTAIPSS